MSKLQHVIDQEAEEPFMNQTPQKLLPPSWQSGEKDTTDDEDPQSPEHNALTADGQAAYNQLNGTPISPLDSDLKARETWDGKVDFLLSVIGFAVDLGNVWRFPYICFRNGGGAFLVPYTIMYIFGGLPLFFMELALGQFQRCGCITVWKRICPMFKGVGFGICIIGLYTASYYNTIISWALFYLINSMRAQVPWDTCGNNWNTNSCITTYEDRNRSLLANMTFDENSTWLNSTWAFSINATRYSSTEEFFFNRVLQVQGSTGLNDIGYIRWEIALCLLAVFTIVYFSLWKGVKSSGKAVWVTATLPYAVLLILLVVGLRLEGSMKGIEYYLYPKFDELKKISVWTDAAAQIFFSLGPGFGVLLALSSYNKFHNNCYHDALVTSAVNCLTSLLAGFVVFSVLGHMSVVLGKDVENIADEGPGLVFIAYPQAIAMLTGSTFWAILFFMMLITLGLDSTFGGLEAILTAILDQWPVLKKRREVVVLCLISFCYLLALPTTTQGGYFVLNWIDQHGAPISILFIVFCECVAICWFYGTDRFSEDIKQMLGHPPGIFWRVCWSIISPVFLFSIFIVNLVTYKYRPPTIMGELFEAPEWTKVLAFFVIGSSIVFVPIFIFYKYMQTSGTRLERFLAMVEPEERPHNETERIIVINNSMELGAI